MNNKLSKKLDQQLQEYYAGKRRTFDFDILPAGTSFQKKVWQALKKIPYGKTMSYKKLAEKIGHPKAARAVGNACNKNPYPIFIPCHRIIGSSGKLGGYAKGLKKKRFLLELEKQVKK